MSLKKTKNKTVGNIPSGKKQSNPVYYLILIIIFVIFYMNIFDSKLDLSGDNFSYLLLSENILNGHGYSNLSIDGTYKPAGWFPPGYPYLLAISKLVVGDNVPGLKILNGLLFLGTILLFFSFIKKTTQNVPLALSVSVLLTLNSGLLRLSTMIMSEIPYLFFTTLVFYAISGIDEKKDEKIFWKSGLFYLVVISSVLSLYMRSFGIVLIGAVAIHWLISKKWKLTGAYLLGNAILYAPYQIRNTMYNIKGRYLKTIMIDNPWRPESGQISTISGFGDKIVKNLNDTIIHGFPKVLFTSIKNSGSSIDITLLGIFILIFVVWGIWRLNRYRYLFGCYIIFNIGVLLVWHTGNGVRYVWPLAGFVLFLFLYGVVDLINLICLKKFNFSVKPTIGYVLLFLCFFSFPQLKVLKDRKNADYPIAYKNYFRIAKSFSKAKKPERFVVVCRKPSMFAYYSHTRTLNYMYSLDDKEVIKHMAQNNVDYVILEQLGYSSTGRYLYPAIQKNQDLFKVVSHLKEKDTYLLLFNKSKAKKIFIK